MTEEGAQQLGGSDEPALPAQTPESARARLLDPARPLKMPGASLREVYPDPAIVVAARRLRDSLVARLSAKTSDAPAKKKLRLEPIHLMMGGLVVFAIVMIGVVPFDYEPAPEAPPAVVQTTQASDVAPPVATATAAADAGPPVPEVPPPPKVFRVGSLKDDPSLEIVEGTVGKRTVVQALAASGLSMRDSYRVLHAFKGKAFDRPGAHDGFVYAKQRSGGRLVAFEYIVPPFDVWQAREGEDGKLDGKKVVFTPETKRVVKAFLVEEDLRKSLQQAELDDDLLEMLDDALEGHAELVDVRPGARLRIVAEEERIEGAFARYSHLDAVEYFPANPKAKAVRVYRFDPFADKTAKKRSHSFYDDQGRQPYKGGFRTPVPLARVTSRFNPRRMHPVLKVVMPHNGVDFAAPTGTPVYATAPGIVRAASPAGPNGNMVQVQHPNGLTSAYCHLSRFAAGLKPGQHVEGRQLVGYVGTTGRSTGPHLHFAIKKGEAFLDPLSLRLDGWRTLSPSDREPFDKVRGELDAALATVTLPVAPEAAAAAAANAEVEDVIYDDVPGAPDAGP